MIFDANQILEKLTRKGGYKPYAFQVSKSIFEKFKQTCKKDKIKYSPTLEEIIKSFLSYTKAGRPIKIYVAKAKDRVPASISCSTEVWNSFCESLTELCLDRNRTLEYLMEEYCKQRSRK